MVLAIHGLVDTSASATSARSPAGSASGSRGPTARTATGVRPRWPWRSRPTVCRATRSAPSSRAQAALRDAARTIQATGAPVILLTWRGAHTWVMTGFRADADPTVFRDAAHRRRLHPRPVVPAGVIDLGRVRSAGHVPGRRPRWSATSCTWQRPEGRYPDRDGLFITVAPTVPTGSRLGRADRRVGRRRHAPEPPDEDDDEQDAAGPRPRARSPAGMASTSRVSTRAWRRDDGDGEPDERGDHLQDRVVGRVDRPAEQVARGSRTGPRARTRTGRGGPRDGLGVEPAAAEQDVDGESVRR